MTRIASPAALILWLVALAISAASADANRGSGAGYLVLWAAICFIGSFFANRWVGLLIAPVVLAPLVIAGVTDRSPSEDVWWTPLFFGALIVSYLEFWSVLGLISRRALGTCDRD